MRWGWVVVGVVCVALGLVALLQLRAVQTQIVEAFQPAFPDWPEPRVQLADGDEGEIFFASHSPFDFQVLLAGQKGRPTTGQGWLTLPEGAEGPVPAMILLPGSGGIKPGREHDYAAFLNQHGMAAFVVEYYAPRGLADESNYRFRTGSVTEFDLITDAFGALQLLSTHPRIDANRIGVMGFSYGGMAARLALDDRFRRALAPEHPGFAAHIDVYGPCFQVLGTRETNGAPLLTLRGTADASNDLEACATRERELRDIGVSVQAVVYEGAGHAWENDAPRRMIEGAPYVEGCEWRYDASGVPYVDGERLVDYGLEASREERIASRLTSGLRVSHCVKTGYLVGRDEAVRERAFEDALTFLNESLRAPAGETRGAEAQRQ
jgi:dienelactone hydrolase